MIQELEWSGTQQLLLLFDGVGLGAAFGVLLEIVTGLGRMKAKATRFALDVSFGLVAALVTFFSDLLFTGGRLHPVMFFGIATGMLLEHITVGKWVARGVRMVRQCVAIIQGLIRRLLWWFFRFLRKIGIIFEKIPKNVKKTRKKQHFFQKKS